MPVMTRLLIILALFSSAASFAQGGKKIMVYANGAKILIPLVQKSLENIRIDSTHLFDRITELNEVYSNVASDRTLREILSYYSSKNFHLSDTAERIYSKVADLLLQYDYFLNIHVHQLNAVLEFQFYLYNTQSLVPVEKPSFPVNEITKPLYYTSFILDITQPGYPQTIDMEIAKLFPFANQKPVPVISRSSGKSSHYITAVKDTMVFNSHFSHDRETPINRLAYNWYVKKLDSLPGENAFGRYLFASTPDVQFTAATPGAYILYLQVHDGIHATEDTIYIDAYQRPQIFLPYKTIKTYYYGSVLRNNHMVESSLPLFSSNFRNQDVNNVQIQSVSKVIDTFMLVRKYYRNELLPKRSLFRSKDVALYDSLEPNSDFIKYELMKAGNRFYIDFKNSAQYDFKGTFQVSVSENGLVSNKEYITIRHTTYSALSFYSNYQHSAFWVRAVDNKDSFHIKETDLRWGTSFQLYMSKNESVIIAADFSMGFPLSRDSTYYFSRPFQAQIRGKFYSEWFASFNVGISYTLTTLKKDDIDLLRNKGLLGYFVGFEFRFLKSLPVFVCPYAGGYFFRLKMPGYRAYRPYTAGVELRFLI
jgi:hypothetical protein